MSDFRTHLEAMTTSLPGTLVASLMSFDGLPVETVETEDLRRLAEEGELDIASLLVEYSSVLGQVQRTGQVFAAGTLEELSIRSEHLHTLIRPVNDEYFVALTMRPEANTARGKYLLRVNAPKLLDAL
jgi:predicted regulator of Ras-like GTPase activity (Roadblock/LC7/MglB family)